MNFFTSLFIAICAKNGQFVVSQLFDDTTPMVNQSCDSMENAQLCESACGTNFLDCGNTCTGRPVVDGVFWDSRKSEN